MKRRINPVVVVCMLIAAVHPDRNCYNPDHAPHSYQETDGFELNIMDKTDDSEAVIIVGTRFWSRRQLCLANSHIFL